MRKRSRDRTPSPVRRGVALFLGLLSSLPVIVVFVVGPLVGVGPSGLPLFRALFLWGTPPLALASFGVRFFPPKAEGPASTAGSVLSSISLLSWILYVGLSIVLGTPP